MFEIALRVQDANWKVGTFRNAFEDVAKAVLDSKNDEELLKVVVYEQPILNSAEGDLAFDHVRRTLENDAEKFIRKFQPLVERAEGPALRAVLLLQMARALRFAGVRYGDAISYLEKAENITSKIPPSWVTKQIRTEMMFCLAGKGEALSALRILKTEAVRYENDKEFTRAFYAFRTVGNTFFNARSYEHASAVYSQARAFAYKYKRGDWSAIFSKDLGDSHYRLKRFDQARKEYESTLGVLRDPKALIARKELEGAKLEEWEVVYELSSVNRKLGKPTVADRLVREAQQKAFLSKSYRGLSQAANSIAEESLNRGDVQAALRIYNSLLQQLLDAKQIDLFVEQVQEACRTLSFDFSNSTQSERLFTSWAERSRVIIPAAKRAELFTFRVSYEWMRGDLKAAEATAEEIVRLAPGTETSLAGLLVLAIAKAFREDTDGALAAVHGMREVVKISAWKDAEGREAAEYGISYFEVLIQLMQFKEDHKKESEYLSQILNDNDSGAMKKSIAQKFYALTVLASSEGDEEEISKKGAERAILNLNASNQVFTNGMERMRAVAIDADMSIALVKWKSGDRAGAMTQIDNIIELLENTKEAPGLLSLRPQLRGLKAEIALEDNQVRIARDLLILSIDEVEANPRQVTGGIRGRNRSLSTERKLYSMLVPALVKLNETELAAEYADRSKNRALIESNSSRKAALQDSQLKGKTVGGARPGASRPWDKYKDFAPGMEFVVSRDNETPEIRSTLQQDQAKVDARRSLPDPETALLQYFESEDNNLYLFVLSSPSDERAKPSGDWRKGLEWSVFDLGNAGRFWTDRYQLNKKVTTHSGGYSEHARNLYDGLIKPAEHLLKGKRSLLIVPDEELWDVPFQLLQPWRETFISEQYSIRYARSIGALVQMKELRDAREQTRRLIRKELLAVGNPTQETQRVETVRKADSPLLAIRTGRDKDEPWSGDVLPIPESATEASNIAKLYGPRNADLVNVPQMSKSRFLKDAGNYRIVHVATHGIHDEGEQLDSALLLGNGQAANLQKVVRNDGLLSGNEIVEMAMNADAVILSACDSSNGLLNLGWAFAAAGVPTVVGTQWKVNDPSTALLMEFFHKHLRTQKAGGARSMDFAKALQNAQGDLRKLNTEYRHPYYWAPFVVIGL